MQGSTDDVTNVLRGQVAIVTGGGRGIGRSIAKAIAAAGGKVCVAARSHHEVAAVVAEIEKDGGRAIASTTDVADGAAVERTVKITSQQLGAPTLLVNNAGSVGGLGRVDSADPLLWWRDIEVTLKGSFLFSRAVLPAMVSRGGGRIINVASDVGIHPSPEASSYACAKAAMLRLTDGLAAETASNGVSVFAISPGTVRTRLTESVLASAPGQRWFGGPVAPKWFEPEQAAKLVVLLASGKADALSGLYLHVSDDIEELTRQAGEIREKGLYALRLKRF